MESIVGKIINYAFMLFYSLIIISSFGQFSNNFIMSTFAVLAGGLCIYICTEHWRKVEENRLNKKALVLEQVGNVKGAEKLRLGLPVGNKNRFKISALCFWGLLFLGSIISAFQGISGSGSTANTYSETVITESEPITPEKEIISITASQLFNQYQANEARASQNFKNKRIKISGSIDSIDSTFNDEPIVHLTTPNMFMSVGIHLVESDWSKATTLDKGQVKSFLCESVDEIIGTPQLNECVLQ